MSETSKTPEVLIELIRLPGSMICSGCGGFCDKMHDWEERWGFGFRDDDYFFLKIRAAFPGIPG